ncbi:hypothetical protein U1Q18_037810 [Sarracenia purpurea var. burkii]
MGDRPWGASSSIKALKNSNQSRNRVSSKSKHGWDGPISPGNRFQKQGKCGNDVNRFHALSAPDFEDYEECFPSLPRVSKAQIKEVWVNCSEPSGVTTFPVSDRVAEGRRLERLIVKALNRAKKGGSKLTQEEVAHLESWLARYRASNDQSVFVAPAVVCDKRENAQMLKVENEDESKVNLAVEEAGMATLVRSFPDENRGAVHEISKEANPEVNDGISSHDGAEAAASGVDLDLPVDDGSDEASSTCEEEETSDEEGTPQLGGRYMMKLRGTKFRGSPFRNQVPLPLNLMMLVWIVMGLELILRMMLVLLVLIMMGLDLRENRLSRLGTMGTLSATSRGKEGDLMGIDAVSPHASVEACPGDAGAYGNRGTKMGRGYQTWANVVATKDGDTSFMKWVLCIHSLQRTIPVPCLMLSFALMEMLMLSLLLVADLLFRLLYGLVCFADSFGPWCYRPLFFWFEDGPEHWVCSLRSRSEIQWLGKKKKLKSFKAMIFGLV